MTARSVKTTNKHAGDAQQDSHRAIEALMAVNESLIAAASICRALVQDGRALQSKPFSTSARRVLRMVDGMKDGPNTKLWDDLYKLEALAQAAYQPED